MRTLKLKEDRVYCKQSDPNSNRELQDKLLKNDINVSIGTILLPWSGAKLIDFETF